MVCWEGFVVYVQMNGQLCFPTNLAIARKHESKIEPGISPGSLLYFEPYTEGQLIIIEGGFPSDDKRMWFLIDETITTSSA